MSEEVKEETKKGRPKKKESEIKKVKSIRIDDATERLILKKYNGSIQAWVDHHAKEEFHDKIKNIDKAM